MTAFTVASAQYLKPLPPKEGQKPLHVVKLDLRDSSGQQTLAEWVTTQNVPPNPGQTLEGDIEQGPYGPKFKKAQQLGRPGGGGKSPEESARITRMHSQDMAIAYARLMHERGQMPESFKVSDLRTLVEWFHTDAWGVKP